MDASGRSVAGGLQFTGQQLGSSLGIALIGAIVLTSLTSVFLSTVEQDERGSAEVAEQVGVAVGSGIDFVSSDQVEAATEGAGLDDASSEALVANYETAQLQSLRLGLLAAALLVLVGVPSTAHLPTRCGRRTLDRHPRQRKPERPDDPDFRRAPTVTPQAFTRPSLGLDYSGKGHFDRASGDPACRVTAPDHPVGASLRLIRYLVGAPRGPVLASVAQRRRWTQG